MPARPSRLGRRPRGFTLVELIGVLILLGIVMVAVMPRMSAVSDLRQEAWRDQVLAALRHAQSTAITRRRLVCVYLETSSVVVAIARRHPATDCDEKLPGPDGDGAWARDSLSIATESSVGNTLYVQPDGRFSADAEGVKSDVFEVRVGSTEGIRIDGGSGLVR